MLARLQMGADFAPDQQFRGREPAQNPGRVKLVPAKKTHAIQAKLKTNCILPQMKNSIHDSSGICTCLFGFLPRPRVAGGTGAGKERGDIRCQSR